VAKLKIFSNDIINELKLKLNSKEYIDAMYSKGSSSIDVDAAQLLLTQIELPSTPPDFIMSDRKTDNEAENAIALYSYIGELNSTQAADMRLWATLAHTTFWLYCLWRWSQEEKSERYVLEHWFDSSKGGLAALRRNAISRLWWAAHLTVAPWEKDPELSIFQRSDRYFFTKVLLSQQQIFQDVMERLFGSNLKLRICWLDALSQHVPKVSNKDDLSKLLAKNLSIIIKTKQLEALSVSDLKSLFHNLIVKCVDSLQKA
jgi:hypothetical protein